MKKILLLTLLLLATFCFGQTPIQTFNFEDNLTNVANNITLNGTGVAYEDGLPGKGRALVINDSYANPQTSRANAGIANMPLNTSDRSFSFWLKVPTQAGRYNQTNPELSRIFRIGGNIAGSPSQGFEFRRVNYTATGIETRFEIYDTGNDAVIGALDDFSATSTWENVWRFITIVYNNTGSSGNFRLYVDGANIGNFTGQLNTGVTNTMTIGGGPGNNQFSIDKFQIYDTVLTNAQVLAIYKEEIKPQVPSPQTFCNGRSLAAVDVQEIPNRGATLQFYRLNNPTPISTTLVNGGDYEVTQTINSVVSNRAAFSVIVNSIPATPAALPATIFECVTTAPFTGADLPTTLQGMNLKWYFTETSSAITQSSSLQQNNNVLWVSQIANGCESARVQKTVSFVFPPTTPTGAATQSLPTGSTVSQIVSSGSNVVWYTSASNASSNTNPLVSTTVVTTGTTYYGVQVTNGCRSANALAVTITTTLSVSDFNSNLTFSLYPNPANAILNIETANEIKSVEIYSLQGQKVLTSTSKTINISSLSKGVYMVRVEDTEGGIATQKFVKE
jgi:hypothetical protein